MRTDKVLATLPEVVRNLPGVRCISRLPGTQGNFVKFRFEVPPGVKIRDSGKRIAGETPECKIKICYPV